MKSLEDIYKDARQRLECDRHCMLLSRKGANDIIEALDIMHSEINTLKYLLSVKDKALQEYVWSAVENGS